MNVKLITAIFPRDRLEAVEEKLRRIGVERVDVSKVRGYGEYRNFYARDWMVDEVRLDTFTKADEVASITSAIMLSIGLLPKSSPPNAVERCCNASPGLMCQTCPSSSSMI